MNFDTARVLLAILVLLNVIKISSETLLAHQLPYTRGVQHLLSQTKLWVRWTPLLFFFCCLLIAWSAEQLELYAGAGILLCVYGVRAAAEKAWPGGQVTDLGNYSLAASLLMAIWIVQCLRSMGWSISPDVEWDVAAGLIAYAWVACGLRKVGQSGWGWARAPNIALLLAERMYTGPNYRRQLSRWFMDRPQWLLLVGVGGLLFELGGFVFCFPELRMGYAVAVMFCMLFNYILFGFFELEWGLVGLVVAVGSQA